MSWRVMDPDDKRRRAKNLALLGILLALAAVLYFVTIVRLGMLR